jgi:hypothetical protein
MSDVWTGIKPCQNAITIGPKGKNDYSKWTFSLIPKEGTNKITAKFSCGNKAMAATLFMTNSIRKWQKQRSLA